MRERDVKRSFGNAVTWEAPIREHASKALAELQQFPFGDQIPGFKIFGENTRDLSGFSDNYDLVYLDPPYLNSRGTGVDYSDFYGFLEGLCDYELFGEGDSRYPHKPIAKKYSNWLNPQTAVEELAGIVNKWKSSILVVSYRSDGVPTPDETVEILSSRGRRVEIHTTGEYKYALSTTNTNEELFLISFP